MKFVFNGAEDERLNSEPIEFCKEEMENATIKVLGEALKHLYLNYKRTNKSFFDGEGRLVYGTICIVNEKDWELTGEENTPVAYGDVIFLISSLHGG